MQYFALEAGQQLKRMLFEGARPRSGICGLGIAQTDTAVAWPVVS